jgi:PIN domain nuclease of toxin-antitoxin system
MNLLLDTHALIWWVRDMDRLGSNARAIISDPLSTVRVSAASVWEIAIKSALGRLEFRLPLEDTLPQEIARNGFLPLPVNFEHALGVRRLPLVHADPFDRMLVAQAACEGLTIVTADRRIREYPVSCINAEA